MIKNTHEYRKMMTVELNNERFTVFMDDNSKLAFMKLKDNGKYKYPTLQEVLLLTNIFYNRDFDPRSIVYENKYKNIKKYKFIPKVFINGSLVLLTASLLTGCGTFATHDTAYYEELFRQNSLAQEQTVSNTVSNDDSVEKEDKTEIVGSGLSEEEIREKYLAYLSPSDDEYDYKWANDYVEYDFLKDVYATDSKAYEKVFGFKKPTLNDLNSAIEKNKKISPKYKKFISDFCSDWLTLYPDSDMSVLMYNLGTLEVEEMTPEKIQLISMSTGTVACYMNKDNKICIRNDANVEDKSNDDYVVMAHELLHACRITKTQIDSNNVRIGFSQNLDLGLYEDEALVTYFAYQLQNMNKKPIYYTLQSTYYRQFMDLVDYDGADYMNHSVNYFIEKVQDAFDKNNINIEALHYFNLMDSQASAHYKKMSLVDYTDFSELYEAQVQIYGLSHLNSDMTYEETEVAFDEFWEDITYNFDALPDPYPTMLKEQYKPYWDTYVENLGISNVKSR